MNDTIEEFIDRSLADPTPNPWTGRRHTVDDIVGAIRIGYGRAISERYGREMHQDHDSLKGT